MCSVPSSPFCPSCLHFWLETLPFSFPELSLSRSPCWNSSRWPGVSSTLSRATISMGQATPSVLWKYTSQSPLVQTRGSHWEFVASPLKMVVCCQGTVKVKVKKEEAQKQWVGLSRKPVLCCSAGLIHKIKHQSWRPTLSYWKKKVCNQDAAPNMKEIETRKVRSGLLKELRWISQQEGARVEKANPPADGPLQVEGGACTWREMVRIRNNKSLFHRA